jgi:antitoxin CptB
MSDPHEYKRVQWHSRRGMLELDLVLLPFVEEVFPGLDRENQDRYIRMLECEDQDLFSWVMTRTVPDEEDLAIIVKLIVDHARSRKGSA